MLDATFHSTCMRCKIVNLHVQIIYTLLHKQLLQTTIKEILLCLSQPSNSGVTLSSAYLIQLYMYVLVS